MRIRARVLTTLMLLAAGCAGTRASSVPLGGKHELDAPAPRGALPAVSAASTEAPPLTPEEEREAEEVEIQAPAAAVSVKAGEAASAAGAFQVRPYAAGQAWTRVVDLDFDVKVGPGGSISMHMVSHQEARFEVLAATAGSIDKLGIEYLVDRSTITIMGADQKDPDVLAGKRYVVTFPKGKPEIRSASGGAPPKKELDSVEDDAREPLEMALALKELGSLAPKGKGDFSSAGATALAGGEDDDTKIGSPQASLRQISNASGSARTAALDLAYKLTNAVGDGLSIEAALKGTVTVLDAPARYQSIELKGPLDLRGTEPGGMEGSGTTKVSISYKY